MACPLGVVFLESQTTHYSICHYPCAHKIHTNPIVPRYTIVLQIHYYTQTLMWAGTVVLLEISHLSALSETINHVWPCLLYSLFMWYQLQCAMCVGNQDMKYLHNYATYNTPHYSVLFMFMVYMKSDTMRGQTGHLGTITLGFPLPHTHTEQVSPCAAIYLQSPCTSFPLPCSSAPWSLPHTGTAATNLQRRPPHRLPPPLSLQTV